MPVHRHTHMYIKSVPTRGYFPFFPEAQVLAIPWASSLSLHFILKLTEHGTILT